MPHCPPPGSGPGPSENGRFAACSVTTSRGGAAPRRLLTATGHAVHIRDSPLILRYAQTLTAARHLQAQLLLRSASGELPRLGPLPRLEVHLFSYLHLVTCGALLFSSCDLRPRSRSSASTRTTRPAWPQLGYRLVHAQISSFCTFMAGGQRAASEWPSPAYSRNWLSPPILRGVARLLDGSTSMLPNSLIRL